MAIPFGSFERLLAAPANSLAAAQLHDLQHAMAQHSQGSSAGGVPGELLAARQLVAEQLVALPELVQVGVASREHFVGQG